MSSKSKLKLTPGARIGTPGANPLRSNVRPALSSSSQSGCRSSVIANFEASAPSLPTSLRLGLAAGSNEMERLCSLRTNSRTASRSGRAPPINSKQSPWSGKVASCSRSYDAAIVSTPPRASTENVHPPKLTPDFPIHISTTCSETFPVIFHQYIPRIKPSENASPNSRQRSTWD